MSKPPKPKYRTTNWSAYNASLRQRGSMLLWIDQDMHWEGAQSGQRGHPPQFSDAVILFCLMIKNLYGLALRQTTGMVQSLLKLAGEAPDFSTLCRRQKVLQVTLTHLRRRAPLHLLVDSTCLHYWTQSRLTNLLRVWARTGPTIRRVAMRPLPHAGLPHSSPCARTRNPEKSVPWGSSQK